MNSLQKAAAKSVKAWAIVHNATMVSFGRTHRDAWLCCNAPDDNSYIKWVRDAKRDGYRCIRVRITPLS